MSDDEGIQLGRKRVEADVDRIIAETVASEPVEPVVDTLGRPVVRSYTAAELVRVRDYLARILDVGGAPHRKAEALMVADVVDIDAVLQLVGPPENAIDMASAWSDYRSDYGVADDPAKTAHKAFTAGWTAHQEGDQRGALR